LRKSKTRKIGAGESLNLIEIGNSKNYPHRELHVRKNLKALDILIIEVRVLEEDSCLLYGTRHYLTKIDPLCYYKNALEIEAKIVEKNSKPKIRKLAEPQKALNW